MSVSEDKSKLSRHKYIYEVRLDHGELHAERRTVMYINKLYVYYRVANSFELTKANVKDVSDQLFDWQICNLQKYGKKVLTWKIPANFVDVKEMLAANAKITDLKNRIEKAEREAASCRKRAAEVDEEVERLKSDLDELLSISEYQS